MEEDFNMGGNNMNNDSKNMGVFGTNNSGFNEKPKGNIGTVLGIINLVLVVILSAGLIYVVSTTNTSNKKIRYIVTVSKTELGVYAVTTDASGKEERIKVEEDNSPANVTTPGTEKPSTGSSEGGNTSNPSNTNNSGNTNNGNGSNTTGNTSGTGSAASSNNKPSGGLDGAVSNLNRSSNN